MGPGVGEGEVPTAGPSERMPGTEGTGREGVGQQGHELGKEAGGGLGEQAWHPWDQETAARQEAADGLMRPDRQAGLLRAGAAGRPAVAPDPSRLGGGESCGWGTEGDGLGLCSDIGSALSVEGLDVSRGGADSGSLKNFGERSFAWRGEPSPRGSTAGSAWCQLWFTARDRKCPEGQAEAVGVLSCSKGAGHNRGVLLGGRSFQDVRLEVAGRKQGHR